MVVINKHFRIVMNFRTELVAALLVANKQVKKGIRSKIAVCDFFLKNNYWPNRAYGSTKRERQLGTRFENFVSKEAASYDKAFRSVAFQTGRKTNHKRKHNVKAFKQEILDFIEKHGRVPMTSYEYQLIPGEATLRHKLDYYTRKRGDMTFLGKVYAGDKCHKSGVPSKLRSVINSALEDARIETPLIRLV